MNMADFIMANPPFNLSNWEQDKLKDDKRWKYGIPPAGNANYAWIRHMIHHPAPNGKNVCKKSEMLPVHENLAGGEQLHGKSAV